MNAWVAVAGAGAGSYLFRLSLVVLLGRVEPPSWLSRVSALVMPAAFAALAAPAVVGASGMPTSEVLARLVALAAGVAVARRTQSPALAIAGGLPVLWVASYLIPA